MLHIRGRQVDGDALHGGSVLGSGGVLVYMDATMVYHFGGWAAFLKPVNKSREEK